jgi:hypothetical protein
MPPDTTGHYTDKKTPSVETPIVPTLTQDFGKKNMDATRHYTGKPRASVATTIVVTRRRRIDQNNAHNEGFIGLKFMQYHNSRISDCNLNVIY